jgi:hypothetical protein
LDVGDHLWCHEGSWYVCQDQGMGGGLGGAGVAGTGIAAATDS